MKTQNNEQTAKTGFARHDERADDAHTAAIFSPGQDEIEWFFTCADADMGRWSSFIPIIVETLTDSRVGALDEDDAMIARLDIARASRIIGGRLRMLTRADQDTLAAYYDERRYPVRVRSYFGGLAGIAVRMPHVRDAWNEARAHRMTKTMTVSEWLEEKLAQEGERSVASFKWDAQCRWVAATRAYGRVRGDRGSVAPRE